MTNLALCIGCSTSRGEPLCPVCELQLSISDSPIAVPSKAAVPADGVSVLPRLLAPSAVLDFESLAKATEGKAGTAVVTGHVRRSTAGTGLQVGESDAELTATSEFMDVTAGETAPILRDGASERWSRSASGQPQPKAPTGGDSRERPTTLSFEDDVAALERAWALMPRYVDLPLSHPASPMLRASGALPSNPVQSLSLTASATAAAVVAGEPAPAAAFSFCAPECAIAKNAIASRTFAASKIALLFSVDPADISNPVSLAKA